MGLFPTHDPAYMRTYAEEAAMIEAGELIARALDAAGITRTELANRLGVAKSEVTERLRGERNITIRKLAATLHELGARLELDLIPATEQRERAEFARLARLTGRGARRPAKASCSVHASGRRLLEGAA